MPQLPDEIKGAVTGFVVLLCKGLIEDERWDWDLDRSDWNAYQAGLTDPTVMRTTMVVFLNSLELDGDMLVRNYPDALFRGFQYFRSLVDSSYRESSVEPPFQPHEIEEPDWRIWEA
jgi:hypothetical protein